MQYQSPFENWYTYSTVHKPLPDFTCNPVSRFSLLNLCPVSAIH
jgi:hypothetical protein